MIRIVTADGLEVMLAPGGNFTCDELPDVAATCNARWPPRERTPQDPVPDCARARAAAAMLNATIVGEREALDDGSFDPGVVY